MTLTIVLIGGVILLVFIVVPLQEFRLILTRLREKPPLTNAFPTEPAAPAGRAFEIDDEGSDDRPQDLRA